MSRVIGKLENTTVLQNPEGNDLCASEHVGELFGLYNQSLLRFLVKKLGSEQEAQDVAQEAFVKLLDLENKNVISHMQTYLFRTANNIAIDRLRRRNCQAEPRQFEENEQESFSGIQGSVERTVEAERRIQFMGRLIDELPPKCRQAFLLYKFECLGYSEIAHRMQLTESMIRKYVLRAICYCQDRMESQV